MYLYICIIQGTWTPYLMQRTMTRCWDHEPHRRPTMAEIIEWTELPEFPSLRTVYRLNSGRLSAVCQCMVDRNHIHLANLATKPFSQSLTAILYDEQEDLFCSTITTSSTKTATLLHKKANKYSQVWIAQESESKDSSNLSIIMYKSGEVGYMVSQLVFF